MIKEFPNLRKPIKLGNVTFKNRMFSAPMGGTEITADCCIGNRSIAFYELRARGGAASVTVSELMVHPETDRSHAFHLDLNTTGSLSSFTYTADAITRHGAIASVELSHSGQYAGTYLIDKEKKQTLVQYGVSDTVRQDGIPVKALTIEQISDIVKSYGEAAALAKRAGFQMVMVHCGHGWLLNQFLSPFFNYRTDEYGGSLENRARFSLEVLDCVRNSVGNGFPIEVRMSGSELFEGGYTLSDGIEYAKLFENKVDLIHVSAGSYQFGFFDTHPSMFSEHGMNVYLAEQIKKHVKKPVATIGALNEPKMMEEIIASGKADVVEMARALLADPYLPRKVMSNQSDRIVKCLRCFTCMAERAVTQTRRCTVNPLIGREADGFDMIPVTRPKKVIVVGGGVAGMQAAITAAQRGHDIVLCEKTDQLGGILKSEQAIPFKYEMYELGITLEKQLFDEGVVIRLNTEVTPEYLEKEYIDALIIAVGSEPIIPHWNGLNKDNMIVVNDYYLEKDKVTDVVAVIGGGLAGCECAIHLAMEGKKVHLIEMRDQLAVDANIRHRPILLKQIEKFVIAHTGLKADSFTADGLICVDINNYKHHIPATSVVCAVGQKSLTSVVDSLRDCAPEVFVVGDCIRPSNITNAIYEGYHAALDV